jgi:hypothetical protein
MLRDDAHAAHIEEHPSLIVIDAARHDDDVLRACAARAASCPIMLIEPEPVFVRRFRETIVQHLKKMKRDRIDVIALHVEEPADLKAGGLAQIMMRLREQRIVDHIGVCHGDVRSAEWLIENSGARVLGIRYGLAEQHAAYRTIPKATEYDMACLRLNPPKDGADLRFALSDSARVLPLCDRPLPAGITVFSQDERETAWRHWQATHEPPPPLDRGRPPD